MEKEILINGMDKMEQAKRVWTNYIAAWNEHGIEKILTIISDSFEYDECPMTMQQLVRGKQQFSAYLKTVFCSLPDLYIEITTLNAGKEMGWSESIMRGTYHKKVFLLPEVKRRMDVKVACAFKVQNGLLVQENLYWDRSSLLRQLGFLPSLLGVITQPVWRP